MSDSKTTKNPSPNSPSKLYICLFSVKQSLSQSLIELLDSDRYLVKNIGDSDSFVEFIRENQKQIDCIIFVNSTSQTVLSQLWELKILLPTIILEIDDSEGRRDRANISSEDLSTKILPTSNIYHSAEVRLYPTQLNEVNSYINLAITKFLNLAPSCDTE